MYNYEKLRERIFDKMSELRRTYSGPDLEAQKVSFLEEMIEKFSNEYIEDEEGNDRTKDFVNGLYNIIMDPANREVLYRFESCPIGEVDRPAFRYKNIPSIPLRNCQGFKMIYIPMEVEVGRCLISYVRGVADIVYLEIADDFKSQLTPSRAIPDCVLAEYGFRTQVEYSPNFMGKPYQVENVQGKVTR